MNVDFRARKLVRFFCAFLRRVSFPVDLHGKICDVLQADFACAWMRRLCSFYAVLKNHPKGVKETPFFAQSENRACRLVPFFKDLIVPRNIDLAGGTLSFIPTTHLRPEDQQNLL